MFLNVHSCYSLHYGTMPVKELVKEACEKKIRRLVLTDINNSSACMEFIRACREAARPVWDEEGHLTHQGHELQALIGISFWKTNRPLYTGIAKNREGMKELNDFLTAHLLGRKELPDVPPYFENAYVIYPFLSVAQWEGKKWEEHEYVGIRAQQLNQLAGKKLGKLAQKLIVWHPVTFKDRLQYRLHQYLRAIGLNTILGKLKKEQLCSPQEYFISESALKEQYTGFEDIPARTEALLDKCTTADYHFGKKNKKYFTGSKESDVRLLKLLSLKGMRYRYPMDRRAEVRQRIEDELKVIDELDFCAYFLITWDIVRYAMEEKGFYHVGRGSGANSVVAYCLKITDVDPIELNLYFERFLNHKRSSPPDFDIDFSWDERRDIQDYIFRKYPHTALLGTTSTFREKAVIREIGKVMGLPKAEMDELTDPAKSSQNSDRPAYRRMMAVYAFLEGLPHQRSIHAGGILIGEEPLTYYTALDLPPKGLPTTQWDMYEAEKIGLDKFDILSQRGIGHIREAVRLIAQNKGESIDIHRFHAFKNDPRLNEQLKSGDPIGCFYIESPAMRQLLKKLGCDNYATLVAASSIIRPGVSSSGMMKMYIQSYHDPEGVRYLSEVLKEQLSDTFGIMVYQEDVIKVCCHYAGLDLADADLLRRGMSGKYRQKGTDFDRLSTRFFQGAKALQRDESVTWEVWRQISSFAGFSFSKAHSASFAVESYQSLFLKTYFPMEFMVAVLNNYGGFYQRWVYVQRLQKMGAIVHLPCINHSREVVTIQETNVYLGWIGMLGLECKLIALIPEERDRNGPYLDLEDFLKRTGASLDQTRLLIRVGAFRCWGKSKKALFWEVYLHLGSSPKPLPIYELFVSPRRNYVLPSFDHHVLEDAYQELELLGYPVSMTDFDLLQSRYRGDVCAAELLSKEGQTVKMVGNFVCQKTVRTVKNTKMWFGTFIDVAGDFFDTVHFPANTPVYPFQGRGCYLILGKVVVDFNVPSVEVIRFAKLPIRPHPALH